MSKMNIEKVRIAEQVPRGNPQRWIATVRIAETHEGHVLVRGGAFFFRSEQFDRERLGRDGCDGFMVDSEVVSPDDGGGTRPRVGRILDLHASLEEAEKALAGRTLRGNDDFCWHVAYCADCETAYDCLERTVSTSDYVPGAWLKGLCATGAKLHAEWAKHQPGWTFAGIPTDGQVVVDIETRPAGQDD